MYYFHKITLAPDFTLIHDKRVFTKELIDTGLIKVVSVVNDALGTDTSLAGGAVVVSFNSGHMADGVTSEALMKATHMQYVAFPSEITARDHAIYVLRKRLFDVKYQIDKLLTQEGK